METINVTNNRFKKKEKRRLKIEKKRKKEYLSLFVKKQCLMKNNVRNYSFLVQVCEEAAASCVAAILFS